MACLALMSDWSTPASDRTGWIPARVRLADYPQRKQLAWQVHGVDELPTAEALSSWSLFMV
jgi:hypothetical protein